MVTQEPMPLHGRWEEMEDQVEMEEEQLQEEMEVQEVLEDIFLVTMNLLQDLEGLGVLLFPVILVEEQMVSMEPTHLLTLIFQVKLLLFLVIDQHLAPYFIASQIILFLDLKLRKEVMHQEVSLLR